MTATHEHPLAAAIRGAGPALEKAVAASRERHPYLIAMSPAWALARTKSAVDTGWTGYLAGPTAGDSVCVWHPARHADSWVRGMFCWASLPTALHRAAFGVVREGDGAHRTGLRPHLIYLTPKEAMTLAAFETGKFVPALLADRYVVEPVAMGWELGEGEPPPHDAAERVAIVFTAHALRCAGDEQVEDTYGAAAALAAVCTGDVDGSRLIGSTEADLIQTFAHTDMLRMIGLTHEDAGDLRVPVDGLPRWCVDVPPWIAANRAALDELTRRAVEKAEDGNG